MLTAMRARRRLLERDAAVSALWDSERRYRELMERTQTPTAVIQDGRFAYANPACCALLGYGPGGLGGHRREDTLPPEDVAWIAERYHRRLQGEAVPSNYEMRVVRQDGGLVWVEVDAQQVEYEGAAAVQVEFHDIDARKLAQEALKRSEEQYRSLVDNMEEGILLTNAQGLTHFANPAVYRLLGLPQERIIGHTIFDYTPAEEHALLRKQLALRQAGQRSSYVTHTLSPGGERIEIEVNATPRYDEHGAHIGSLALLMDITERKRAEALLRDSETKFRAFAEQSVVGFQIVQDGHITYTNQAISNLTGYSAAEMLSWGPQDVLRILHPEDRQAVRAEYAAMSAPGAGARPLDCRILTKSGETRWIAMHGAPTELGGVPSLIVLMMDITERKLSEAAMQQQQREESIATLAGGIAHDFNNILLGVLGSATMLSDSLPASHPDHDLCELIATSARRMSDLTAKLLAYARGGRYQPVPVDVNEMVRDVVTMLRGSQPGQVQVELHQAPELWPVEADPGQLQQVLLNLVFNGYESMAADGGTISILTENLRREAWTCTQQQQHPAGDYVHFAVRDCGPGMDQATLSRAFEPYFSTKAPGRGLGLAAVLGIVRNHGGCIDVDSAPGCGTTFHVYLPRGEREVLHVTPGAEPGQGGNETILVVDDEDLVLSVARRILARQGYTVLAAHDGAAGLALAQQQLGAIDLALVDVQMPVMDGVELLAKLRELGYRGRALLTSGYNYSLPLHQPPPGAVDGFLSKPYSANDLLESVRNALDGVQAAAGP